MHIGFLIYGTLDTISGGYIYDQHVVDHLRAQGHRVDLISLPWRHYAAHLSDNQSDTLFAQLSTAAYDLLIQDELNHPSLFALNRRLKRHISYPLVSLVHHLRSDERRPPLLNQLYRYVEQAYLETIDGFIFNSQTTKERVARLVSPLPPHVVATPAGDRFTGRLSLARIQRRTRREGLRIACVASLQPRKGIHLLVEALAQLPPDVTLALVGPQDSNPAYTAHIEGLVETHGLQRRVHIYGQLDGLALREQLVAADVFAMPSSYEGFGIAYLEGMAFGLPAIGTTAGAAWELITHGVNGYLVPPEKVNGLVPLLDRLRRDKGLLLRMSQNALERYNRQPTWTESCTQIEHFLQAL